MSKLKVVAMVLVMSAFMMKCQVISVTAANMEQDVSSEKDVETEVVEEGKISAELEEKLVDMSDEQSILVDIQLVDSVDVTILENEAYKKNGIDKEEFELRCEEAVNYDDATNEEYQQSLIEEYDKIKETYNNSLVEYYTKLCGEFIGEYVSAENIEECYYSPFIESVMMAKSDIYELSENEAVEKIYYHNVSFVSRDYDDINNTYKAIGGNTAVNNGYKGAGIRVGMIESGNPDTLIMGNDSKNIVNVRYTAVSSHATLVAGIIKKFAPDCTIYSVSVSSDEEVIKYIETLITKYNVHVINISYGSEGYGVYDTYSNRVDYLAYKYRVPIVVASGNSGSTRDTLNRLCMGPNVIAVGAVRSSGNSLSSGKFEYWIEEKDSDYDSAYIEGVDVDKNNTGQPYCNDYDVRIYKNGNIVKTSNAWTNSTTYKNTNCEIIELSVGELERYKAGYYEVRIVRTGAWQGSGTVKYHIGMAWEQY